MHGMHSEMHDKICLECNREFTGIMTVCPHDNSLLFARVQDPFVGTTLAGNYEIESVIGHGGMGVVYKARHALMDRTVAIKMLQAQLISDSMSVKRFQQESKAASRINHPNVITVYDFGISPTGQPYIVMDYLEGISLADVIKHEGQVSVERAIRVVAQACDALDHAHKQGVVHRDLKPTNIVLVKYDDEADFVKVVDFGVAKLMNSGADGQRLTQAGEVCGSPVYMSPEQCMGMELDPRSDIYSMGVVIYETLTGKLPILGKTMVDTMSKHISEQAPRFSETRPDLYIPERLESVIFKALAKDPIDRHQTMEELKNDLELAIPRPGRSQVLRTQNAPEGAAVAAAIFADPKKIGIAVVIAACAIGAAGFAVAHMHNPKPAPARVTAPPPPVQPTPVTAPTKPTTENKEGSTSTEEQTKEKDSENKAETDTSAEDNQKSTSGKPETTPAEPNTEEPKVETTKPHPTASIEPRHVVRPVMHKPPPPKPHAVPTPTPHKAPASSEGDRWKGLMKERSY
ncbi:MAG TPA: serine/threonine-protein kinase [Planktothrix sp.]|jgi:serine/threonine-protein kinase